MSAIETAGLTVFVVLLFAGVYVTIFGLPGTIVIFLDVLLYVLFTGFDRISFPIIALLAMLTIITECIGFALEIKSTTTVGPSVKGFAAAVGGSLLGALLLAPILLGLGVLLGIFLGGFLGFFMLELSRQSRLQLPYRAPVGALLATASRIVGKGSVAVAMTIITLTNIYS